jgi:hypothetical protein
MSEELVGMPNMANLNGEAVRCSGEAKVEKVVFRAVRESVGLEAGKIEIELDRQLDVIFGDLKPKKEEVWNGLFSRELLEDSLLRIKREVKQLLVYLERIMALNVAQDLSVRLKSFTETKRYFALSNCSEKKRGDEGARMRNGGAVDTLGRVSENEDNRRELEDNNRWSRSDGYDKIMIGMETLLDRVHDAAGMMEKLSKKCCELGKENIKLKRMSEG